MYCLLLNFKLFITFLFDFLSPLSIRFLTLFSLSTFSLQSLSLSSLTLYFFPSLSHTTLISTVYLFPHFLTQIPSSFSVYFLSLLLILFSLLPQSMFSPQFLNLLSSFLSLHSRSTFSITFTLLLNFSIYFLHFSIYVTVTGYKTDAETRAALFLVRLLEKKELATATSDTVKAWWSALLANGFHVPQLI